jgi:UDP-N-acetylmuramoyl-tripeptide--D-alanyl-D-alanine ligase
MAASSFKYSCDEIAHWVGGERLGRETVVTGASIHSQVTRPGDLFFALRGERSDGHLRVGEAFAAGAVAAVVNPDRLPPADRYRGTLIAVPDPLLALGQVGAAHRRRFQLRVVGVTGSLGKTTAKDLIAAVLAQRYRTLKSQGNMNTEIGVPLTLVQLAAEHEAAVVELAMRGRGQIRELARMAEPEIGVVTNIGLSHLELLGSQDAIAEAKAELLEELPPTGTAILNADDPYTEYLATRALRAVRYGFAPEADVRCEGLARAPRVRGAADGAGMSGGIPVDPPPGGGATAPRAECGAAFRWSAPAFGVEGAAAAIPVPGRHNVMNALAAIAVGLWLELTPEEIAEGLAGAEISAMRMELLRGPRGSLVLNDAYNASSPAAMLAALDVLATQAEGRRPVAVLGNMLELGPASSAAHREVGEAVARPGGPELLITVGSLAREIAVVAREHGMFAEQVIVCPDNHTALQALHARLEPEDVVLIKGSRGMAMEAIVWGLVEGGEPGVPR